MNGLLSEVFEFVNESVISESTHLQIFRCVFGQILTTNLKKLIFPHFNRINFQRPFINSIHVLRVYHSIISY